MYGRSRHSRYGGSWYQSIFWFALGILAGQILRFNITLGDDDYQSQTTPAQIVQTLEGTHNA